MLLKLIPAFFILFGCSLAVQSQNLKKPEENRFTKVVLAQRIEEPMQFQVLKDGRVLFAQRHGKLEVFDPATGKVSLVATFPVSTQYVSKTGEVSEGEDGLQGVILDPDFEKNHWIYVYYSPAGSEPKNVLERYEWHGKELLLNTKKVVLDVPVQREQCCHVGGGMLFDKENNLYLSTGDNTFSRASDGFTPLDERPGKSGEDSQKGSSNSNDLRGKILRIHPEPDGTYSIPKGNLFGEGVPQTRPEIYTMGNRNPWRLTIDSKTGWLYWGEVGPDGSQDDIEKRGPQSYDEFNIAKRPGNYGWPYFIGDNKPYRDYNFDTKTSGSLFDPANSINDSPNNTGIKNLPPALPAIVWYGKGASTEFPLLGTGSNSAVGGPIYRLHNFNDAKRAYPSYYDGKWFVTDFARGWINVIELDENGGYRSMERFLSDLKLNGPLDMKFGPEGDLYVIEYGNGYFKNNPEAELIRIEYNGGNRKPQVQASSSKIAGAIPLKVNLSSEGTRDFDEGDVLKYEWKVTRNGAAYKTFTQSAPTMTLASPGTYKATLTVTDQTGAKNSETVEIKAGNEPPKVNFTVLSGNKSFFFPGKSIKYAVSVNDSEDGSLQNKRILPSQVSVSANYLSEGFNLTEVAQKQISTDVTAQFAGAMAMINKSDCNICHAKETKSLGPAFVEIAKKYKGDVAAPSNLIKKIINGGSGVWGHTMMPAHPTMTDNDARTITNYILSMAYPPRSAKNLPAQGSFTTVVPEGENVDGSFILRAAYKDRGANGMSSQTTEKILVLRSPVLSVAEASEMKNVSLNADKTVAIVSGTNAFLKFSNVDLTSVSYIELIALRGRTPISQQAKIEIRTASPDGKLIGTFQVEGAEQQRIRAVLNEPAGSTDLYIVFADAPLRIRQLRLSDRK
ncbi:PQQ-dependent sugar dehydrogenase [Daejeonella sp.]|uniref:PQQ-dependent sugar dehydrogenase n=1 Tax=Daejeonella sp. TaxID=2805397 RepID=UPI00398324B4